MEALALFDFHLRNGLPAVDGNKPSVSLSAAAQVQDQFGLVASKRS